MVRRDARILVGADSTVIDASDAALEIVGLTLEELRELPPGGLAIEEDRTGSDRFRAAWAETGGGPILGAGTIRLLDGRLIRIRYLVTPQADGTYEVILERSDEPVSEPPRAYTLGAVLSKWRTAERELAELARGGREWTAVQAEIDHFRTEYQRLARDERERLDGRTDSGVG
jgi:PAS domain-containing protein